MNLSDMLGYADIQQLSRIADMYQCECNGNSKNDLIQSILSTVSRKEVFEAQVSNMSIEDLRFLNSLLFEARESFSLEDLIARVQQSRFGDETKKAEASATAKPRRSRKKSPAVSMPPSPREMIVRFKHQGWLFNGYSGPNRYLFQVPKDLKQRFREALQSKFIEQLQYTDEPPVYRDEQMLLQQDVTQFLHYIFQNEIQLAADGSMYKRYLLQLLNRFSVSEQPPVRGEWRFGYGRYFNHYPNRFSLLYDYCWHAKWLSEKGDTLKLTDAGMERLTESSGDESEKQYRLWLRLYKGPVVHLLSLVHWMNALAEQWVTVESLKKVLVPFIKPYYYDDATTILEQRIMTMMLHLGLLRLGEHPLHGAVIRMTKSGHAIINGVRLDEEPLLLH